MTIDRRTLLELATGAAVLTPALASAQSAALPAGLPEPDESIDLWPKGAPGMPARPPVEEIIQRATDPSLTDRSAQHVTRPRMSVFRPLRPNGAAVLVMPAYLVWVERKGQPPREREPDSEHSAVA